MAVRSIRNQYRGINAHLHSLWQGRRGWQDFHDSHIVHLRDDLKAHLIPKGYTAGLQDSLQIRRIGLEVERSAPESDVTIYAVEPQRQRSASPAMMTAPAGEQVMPLLELLRLDEASEKTYNAIVIYERGDEPGEPVAWLELLSPSNKPGGRDGAVYQDKRQRLLETGLVFIELDYLHETHSTLQGLPEYVGAHQADAHPYRILIADPRPSLRQGTGKVRGVDVDEPLPALTIPLLGADGLVYDFGTPYHKTLSDALYGLELVDYAHLPLNFERYSPADQARIANRMLAVLEAQAQGLDLESGPFPVGDLPLDEGLARLKQWTGE